MTAANVLWLRARAAVVGQYLPADGIDLVLSAPVLPQPSMSSRSSISPRPWVLGREAAETLRLEPIFGGAGHPEGVEATALRHGMIVGRRCAQARRLVRRCCSRTREPERLLSVALAGAAAGLDLMAVIHRESGRSGDGIVLHLRKRSAEDRLRKAVTPGPLRLGAESGHLTYPELAIAIERAVTDAAAGSRRAGGPDPGGRRGRGRAGTIRVLRWLDGRRAGDDRRRRSRPDRVRRAHRCSPASSARSSGATIIRPSSASATT